MAATSPHTSPVKLKGAPLPPPVPSVPTFVELLDNIPPRLTLCLVTLSPYISRIRWATEVLLWKSAYSESWLALSAWWALCLLSTPILRYMLPFAAVALLTRHSGTRRPSAPPTTEKSLQATFTDLTLIESSITPTIKAPVMPLNVMLRAAAILYVPYLGLTYFVRLRVLLGLFGSVILTWNAPWARTLRLVLWRSAWIRWGLAHLWSRLSGQTLHIPTLSVQTSPEINIQATSVRFLFTIYENQRWWVGLDWTAALLPGERPSWCSASQQPLTPPTAFALPAPKTIFLSDGKGGVLKRTARWTWEEGEWKVIVKKEKSSMRRVEKTLPTGREELPPSASRIDKTMLKMKELSTSRGRSSSKGSSGDVETADDLFGGGGEDAHVEHHELESDEPLTDGDGWTYGDNQWKGMSENGGMGKYTRHRRWTRIAALNETVEPASASEIQSQADIALKALVTEQSVSDDNNQSPSAIQGSVQSKDEDGNERSGLRKRLKAVIHNSSL